MERLSYIKLIQNAFKINPIVALLSPRQCGKTTLARHFFDLLKGQTSHYFDLERIGDINRLAQPELTLSNLHGFVVIDEIQRSPELFPTLRVLVDQPERNTHYLILGSASRELIQQSSESLAGRITYLELTPFNFSEVGGNTEKLWLRGGFPRSYLATDEESSLQWREEYIRTFLEQDIPNLGIKIPPTALRRFWLMLTHYHGNVFNASELGRSLGLSHNTIRNYLDILSGTFMVRQLTPWFENINKRQVKSPKIYFRDSGIFNALAGISNKATLLTHPKLGAAWEGFALEEIIRHTQARPEECFFWATHAHAELDLLIIKRGQRWGFEIKYSDAPKLSKSMQVAIETLKLDKLFVVYPGSHRYPIGKNIHVIGLTEFLHLAAKKDILKLL